MLMNYDAKAVAEIMGLAFLRDTKPAVGSPAREFVIDLDNDAVLMVEIQGKNTLAPFGPSGTLGRPADLARRRVASPSLVCIQKAVESGLPRQALRHVAESLAGDDRSKVANLEWGVVPKTTLERRDTRLSPQESERTERVARLFVHARRALGTAAEARAFMTTHHPELDGRTPLDSTRTDFGMRRTEHILNALEYGLAL